MLVLTCVDGALGEEGATPCRGAREALQALSADGVPVVLTSHHPPAELIGLQRELAIREPFIADTGRYLYIPRGYFGRLPNLSGTSGDWEVFEFTPASVEEAIELLMWLFRVSGDSPLLIGVGASWRDHLLLRHVDVPVLVRNPHVDQSQLRVRFPDAYITASTGIGGWREALLGVTSSDAESVRDAANG
jgi:predicted mannosyl-3-phosphoglycerate phosphatase (HAD superfamily)